MRRNDRKRQFGFGQRLQPRQVRRALVRDQRERMLARKADDAGGEVQHGVVIELYDAEALTIDLHGNELRLKPPRLASVSHRDSFVNLAVQIGCQHSVSLICAKRCSWPTNGRRTRVFSGAGRKCDPPSQAKPQLPLQNDSRSDSASRARTLALESSADALRAWHESNARLQRGAGKHGFGHPQHFPNFTQAALLLIVEREHQAEPLGQRVDGAGDAVDDLGLRGDRFR